MRQYFGAILTMALSFVPFGPARADDLDAKSILDKAIKALGGEEKLAKVAAYSLEIRGHHQFQRQRERVQQPGDRQRPRPPPARVRQ